MFHGSPDGVVQHIHENAIPLDETLHIPGGETAFWQCLEINGGMSGLLGITEVGS